MQVRLASCVENAIVKDTIVDGPGLRIAIFMQGCKHKCKGCHNPQSHNFNSGVVYDVETIKEVIKKARPLKRGITLTGGDPAEQPKAVIELAKFAHSLGLDVWLYTGYTFEELLKDKKRGVILSYIDVLVDGKFVEEKKNLLLRFRGSENQRVIDVKKSLEQKKVIEFLFADEVKAS